MIAARFIALAREQGEKTLNFTPASVHKLAMSNVGESDKRI